MKVRILNIDWDLYDEDSGKTLTPEQAGVPDHIDIEVPDGEDVDEAVEEYMDKNFEWCYKACRLEKGLGNNPKEGRKCMAMKSLVVALLAVAAAVGCCTSGRTSSPAELVMVRRAPVAQYKETLAQMVEEIEKQNMYEAMDVKDSIYDGHVTIAVYAERMSESRLKSRSIVRLQDEIIRLKKENSSLKKELELSKKGN